MNERLHKIAVEAAARDRAGGTSTGEFALEYSYDYVQRLIDLAFIRGFKAGAAHQLDVDKAVLAELDKALANLYSLWKSKGGI